MIVPRDCPNRTTPSSFILFSTSDKDRQTYEVSEKGGRSIEKLPSTSPKAPLGFAGAGKASHNFASIIQNLAESRIKSPSLRIQLFSASAST